MNVFFHHISDLIVDDIMEIEEMSCTMINFRRVIYGVISFTCPPLYIDDGLGFVSIALRVVEILQ